MGPAFRVSYYNSDMQAAYVPVPHYKFTVADYYRMAELGILDPNKRVELLEGEIVEMTPIGGPHAFAVSRIVALFVRMLASENVIVHGQNPVRLGERSEPQPDIALLRPGPQFPRVHPQPEDVLLIIEVADTSLAIDRFRKAPIYAGAGIVELWIVNLNGETVEVLRQPSVGGYASAELFSRGQSVSPLAFPGLQLLVDQFLE
jgi:Uma2 family endonuclease